MKKILLFAFALTLSVNAYSQLSWTQQNSAFTAATTGINTIAIVDNNVAWALGYDGSAVEANYQTFTRTTNAGTTWSSGTINVGNTNYIISDLTAVSGTTAWVVATPTAGGNGGGVWKTTNSGSTWTKQASASFSSNASFANTIHFWDDNNGVAMGDPTGTLFEIYTTTNGGTNWTKLTSASVAAATSGEAGYVHLKEVAGDNIWFGTSKGRIFKSANKGATWTVVSTPISDFGSTTSSGKIALKDANTAWILNDLGNVYSTTDGGANWTTLPTTLAQASDITYVPGTTSTLIAVGNGAGSSVSYNGGTTWTTIESTNSMVSVAALNTSTVFGGGFNTSATVGGVYKSSGSLGVNDAINKKNNNLSIYPNPTKGEVNIKTDKKIKSTTVLDLSGKVLTVGSSETVNLSAFTKGTYLVKVEFSDGSSKTEKIIKD
ncbi:WD40/YVTN/BNR-like repeat-containing protein [Chryseobacterium mulctrae]|uniref:WD40/YVTN/BNR-like repeat-containing protein n=1 Tax=Chryseobacterium mulctrae TaxID=2576777 RepID=UPI0011172DBB|nr:T9SS type A sorting domain-containing protein [Chryseobacterium mulctrae]